MKWRIKSNQDNNNNIVYVVLITAVDLSYNSFCYLLNHMIAVPKVVYAITVNPKTRLIAKKIGYIALEDLLPLLLVAYGNGLIHQVALSYLSQQTNLKFLSLHTLIKGLLCLLRASTTLFQIRKKLKIFFRSTILAIETGESLHKNLAADYPTPCAKKSKNANCSKLRYLKGIFRDLASYQAGRAAIYFVQFTPYIGRGLSYFLASYHHGRYVMTLSLGALKICSRHKEEYLKEYPELAFTQGLIFFSAGKIFSALIHHITGIPTLVYESSINYLILIFQLLLTSYVSLPKPVQRSNRWPDPVAAYIKMTNFLFDHALSFLKKQLPFLFKDNTSNIPLEKILNISKKIWNYPLSKQARFIVLPRILRSSHALMQDKVVPWNTFRNKTVGILEDIEAIQGNVLVQFISKNARNMTSHLSWLILGIPKTLTSSLLEVISDPQAQEKLSHVRIKLSNMHKDIPSLPPRHPEVFALRQADLSSSSPLLKKNSEEKLEKQTEAKAPTKSQPNKLLSALNCFQGAADLPSTSPHQREEQSNAEKLEAEEEKKNQEALKKQFNKQTLKYGGQRTPSFFMSEKKEAFLYKNFVHKTLKGSPSPL